MFCKYCGKEIDDNAVFCKYCGKKLKDSSDSESSENRSDTGNAKTPYQQKQLENIQQVESQRFDKVLAQNFNIDPDSEVIMTTSFHGAKRFASSILLLCTAVFFMIMLLVVAIAYRPHWALFVISLILFIASLIYFIISTMRITRAVFAVTDTQLLINTWMPSQKLTIPLDQIERVNINIIPFFRNEYGDVHLSVNGKAYYFHPVYKPTEFRDALMNQIEKTKQQN